MILLQACMWARAQSVNTLMGARAVGMAYASSTLKDEWALFNNPGALAEVKRPSTLFAYEVRPALEGADRIATGILIPTKFGVSGLGVFRFGDQLYSEQTISAAFSNKFGIASLGAKVDFIQYKAEGFETKNAVGVSFGGLAQITPQISVGAYIVNINQPKISETEQLPTKLTAGLGFRPATNFFISTEIEKDINYNATWKLGAEYMIHKKVFARTGFNLNPATLFFGTGFLSGSLAFDYALTFSRVLGGAHQVSATYRFGKSIER